MNAPLVVISEHRSNVEQIKPLSPTQEGELLQNGDVLQPSTVVLSLDMQRLGAARSEAARRGVSVVSVLEETCGCGPQQLIDELGRLLNMPVLTMENLRSSTPAFDILSFNDATSKEC